MESPTNHTRKCPLSLKVLVFTEYSAELAGRRAADGEAPRLSSSRCVSIVFVFTVEEGCLRLASAACRWSVS